MRIFLLTFLISLFYAPLALAVDPDALVTCDGTTAAGVPCDFCKFVEMVHKVGEYLVGLLIIIAVIVFAITGVQMAMSAGNPEAWSTLKERLVNVVIGFILILAAWTLVDTLLKALVSDDKLLQLWQSEITDYCATPRS